MKNKTTTKPAQKPGNESNPDRVGTAAAMLFTCFTLQGRGKKTGEQHNLVLKNKTLPGLGTSGQPLTINN
jgi:hypothetical protein